MEFVPLLRSIAAFTEARSPATAIELPRNATANVVLTFGFAVLIRVAPPYVVTCQFAPLPLAVKAAEILSTGKLPRASSRPLGLAGSATEAARISVTSRSGLNPVAETKSGGICPPIFASMNCPNGLLTELIALAPARTFASGITRFISCGSAPNAAPAHRKLNRTAVCRIKYLSCFMLTQRAHPGFGFFSTPSGQSGNRRTTPPFPLWSKVRSFPVRRANRLSRRTAAGSQTAPECRSPGRSPSRRTTGRSEGRERHQHRQACPLAPVSRASARSPPETERYFSRRH